MLPHPDRVHLIRVQVDAVGMLLVHSPVGLPVAEHGGHLRRQEDRVPGVVAGLHDLQDTKISRHPRAPVQSEGLGRVGDHEVAGGPVRARVVSEPTQRPAVGRGGDVVAGDADLVRSFVPCHLGIVENGDDVGARGRVAVRAQRGNSVEGVVRPAQLMPHVPVGSRRTEAVRSGAVDPEQALPGPSRIGRRRRRRRRAVAQGTPARAKAV